MRSFARGVVAVLAGLVVLTVLSFALEALANALLGGALSESMADQPPSGHTVPVRLLSLALTLASVAAGGYVTAWIAGRGKATRHALILGIMEVVMTVGAMLVMGNAAPLWSWIAAIVLIIPAAWLGGRVRSRATTSAP